MFNKKISLITNFAYLFVYNMLSNRDGEKKEQRLTMHKNLGEYLAHENSNDLVFSFSFGEEPKFFNH